MARAARERYKAMFCGASPRSSQWGRLRWMRYTAATEQRTSQTTDHAVKWLLKAPLKRLLNSDTGDRTSSRRRSTPTPLRPHQAPPDPRKGVYSTLFGGSSGEPGAQGVVRGPIRSVVLPSLERRAAARSLFVACGEIAQSVEHRTENAGVPSSILGLATIPTNLGPLAGERPVLLSCGPARIIQGRSVL